METVLPQSINFSNPLPQGVPAVQKRRKFYPSTGAAFGPGLNPEIRIDLESANMLLDPVNSYLNFTFQNDDVSSVGLEISDSVFFDTLRIEQGGRVISRIENYNRLQCSVLAPAQMGVNGVVSETLTCAQKGGAANGARSSNPIGVAAPGNTYANLAHNNTGQLAQGHQWKFSVPIMGGLFTQDKLIPLPLLKPGNPISIVLTLTNGENIGAWAAAGGPIAPIPYTLTEVCYCASMVEVGRDVMDHIRDVQDRMGGQLVISSQDWEYASTQVPIAARNEFIARVPARHRSIKSLFWNCNSEDFATNTFPNRNRSNHYNLSYAGTMNGISYQLKVGSVVFPPQPVAMAGASAPAVNAACQFRRSEMITETAKAFGSLGWTAPTGIMNTTTYASGHSGQGNGDNGTVVGGGAEECPFGGGTICGFMAGLDLDSWARVALEGGVDTETMALESNLIITIDPASLIGPGLEPKTLNMWVLYDTHFYFNRDGMITFSN